jgi:uncharacterized protein (UPF0335 family)
MTDAEFKEYIQRVRAEADRFEQQLKEDIAWMEKWAEVFKRADRLRDDTDALLRDARSKGFDV